VFNRAYASLLFDVATVPFPSPGKEQACLDALERICALGDTAAFIVEPLLLGAGGMLIYPAHILAEMRKICSVHGVLFIADEVMTAWGRTGTLLACEQAGIVPDILCLSKGLTGGSLPLAVTMATPPVYEAHYSPDRSRQFFHSSSYTANPIACAAANANLAIWREEPVLDRIRLLQQRQADALARLEGNCKIANVRQLGTVTAMDIVSPSEGYLSDLAPALKAAFSQRSILLRPLGNTIYVMPPFCIEAEDLAATYQAIGEVVALLD
jgi:adenosylmethionine-8-amino-7-oxononanoate aminotransferase